MSGDQKNPEERVPEPENSSDPEPGTAEHSVQMFAQEHFLEHVQELLQSVDPSQFVDSWDGCVGDDVK